jgi:colicin import membrane protein
MREPSLKETTALSIVLHAVVLFIAFFVIKRSNYISLPSPYVVKLVSPTELKQVMSKSNKARHSKPNVATIREIKKKRQRALIKTKKTYSRVVKPEVKTQPSSDISYKEAIAALKAKKRIEEKVRKKRELLSIKKQYLTKERETPKTSSENISSAENKDTIFSTYYSLITERIWSEWVYPEFKNRENLLAVINIKILKNGEIKILGVEKSSGNTLFDRSAIRAIRKASPLPPPPFELEVGLKFSP